MPNATLIRVTPVAESEASTNRIQLRVVCCGVLTSLNAIVVSLCAGTLYHVTSHKPIEQIGVTLLFGALLGSLIHTWFLALTRQKS
jgi:hypothetical protein